MYKCCIFDLDGTLINSIKAIAYSSSNKHNWDKGNLKCEEYIIIVKKAKNYIYSGKWTITSIFPFPVGFSCWSY